MQAPTEQLRRIPGFLRAVSWVVLVAFLSLTLQPLAIAASQPSPTAVRADEADEAKLEETLEKVESTLERIETKTARGEDTKGETEELKAMRQDIDAFDNLVRQNFAAIEQQLKDKKLPQVILDRHHETVRKYQEEIATVKRNLDDAEREPEPAKKRQKHRKTKDHLKAKPKRKAYPAFDPNDLPSRSLEPDFKKTPKTRKEDYVRAGLLQ